MLIVGYRLSRLAKTKSPWVTIYLEHWKDASNHVLEYWRVARPDSVIVMPILNNKFILPLPSFRVGVNQPTLDFPGGRLEGNVTKELCVTSILERELGAAVSGIRRVSSLNNEGWIVDSSFSNQRIWVFVAYLDDCLVVDEQLVGASFPTDSEGCRALLDKIECLQRRPALLERMLGKN